MIITLYSKILTPHTVTMSSTQPLGNTIYLALLPNMVVHVYNLLIT